MNNHHETDPLVRIMLTLPIGAANHVTRIRVMSYNSTSMFANDNRTNPVASLAAPANVMGIGWLLGALHVCAGLAVWNEPTLLDSIGMRMDALHSPSSIVRCVTGVFAFSNSFLANFWTGLFAAAFAVQIAPRLGRIQTICFYVLCGAFGCAMWGLGFVLTGEKVCVGAPLQTSAAATGIGIFAVSSGPMQHLRFFRPLPVLAWAGLVGYLGVSFFLFWKDSWSVVMPAHIAAGAFALLIERLVSNAVRSDARVTFNRFESDSQPLPPKVAGGSDFRSDDSSSEIKPATSAVEEALLDLKLDEILEKITKSGSESLNGEERELLLRASEHLRLRRR